MRVAIAYRACGADASAREGLSFAMLRVMPSAAQLAWQRDELALFLHFGVNTFTDREWGDGREAPSIFLPSALDARQGRTQKAAATVALEDVLARLAAGPGTDPALCGPTCNRPPSSTQPMLPSSTVFTNT